MSRSRGLMSAGLLLLLPLTATAQGGHGGGLPVSESFEFPKGQRRVVIPFTDSGEHVIIPISVNGSEPLEMVFDTGMPSPGVLLYEGTAADRITLQFSPMKIRVGGAGSAEAKEARLATDVRLGAGALTIRGSVAIVMPPTPQMSSLHDGIIGATLFRNLIVTIDRDRHELVLEKPEGHVPPRNASVVPLDTKSHHAYVKAGLVGADGKVTPLDLVLDLGATHAVSLNRHSNAAIVVPPGAISTRVGRGMGGVMTGQVGRIAGFELGGHRMKGVIATFPDSAFENPRGLDSRDGNLGGGILGRFNVTLDYPHDRLLLVPNSRMAEPFEWEMTGARFDLDDAGRLVASEVLAGSPAEAAGIAVGDTLVAVEGQPADARQLQRQRSRFREPGRMITMTVRGPGGERTVKLTLRRLV